MSSSETSEKRRTQTAIGMTLSAVALLAAIGFGWYVMSPKSGAGPMFPEKAFFSSDNGASYFIDDGSLVAPFDRSGKTVYQAAVFKCPDKAPFVGYLMKYSKSGKETLEALPKAERLGVNPKAASVRASSLSVKKPLTDTWVPLDGEHPAGDILRPACADGSGTPEQITP